LFTDLPDGQISEILSSSLRKNISIYNSEKPNYIHGILFHTEGRFANVTNVGAGCDGRSGPLTTRLAADG
jgi:hypothetical protein